MKKNHKISFGKDTELSFLPAHEGDRFYHALYNDLKKYPPLSREEEQELFEQYRKASDESEKRMVRDRLVLHNMRCVVAISKQCYDGRFQFMDIVSEGIYGLIQSIDKYDPSKGTRLYTFASHYILKYIKQFKHDYCGTVSYAFSRYRTIYRLFIKYIYDKYYTDIEESEKQEINKMFKNPICAILDRYDSVFEEFKLSNSTVDVISYKQIIYKELSNNCLNENPWQIYIPSEHILNSSAGLSFTYIDNIEKGAFSDNSSATTVHSYTGSNPSSFTSRSSYPTAQSFSSSTDNKFHPSTDPLEDKNILADEHSDIELMISNSSFGTNLDYIESIRLLLFRKILRMYHPCSAIFILYKFKMSIRYLSFMKSKHTPEEIKNILKKIHDGMIEKEDKELESLYLDAIPYLYRHIRKGCDAKKSMQVVEELKNNPVIIRLLKLSIYTT